MPVSEPLPDRTPAAQQAALFDYFIGAREKGRRNRNAKRFGSLEVDRQIEFRGLHDRQIGRLFAFQNASCVRTGFSIGIRDATAITYESAQCDILAPAVHRRRSVPSDKRDNARSLAVEKRLTRDN